MLMVALSAYRHRHYYYHDVREYVLTVRYPADVVPFAI